MDARTEVVSRFADAFNRVDLEAALEASHPDVEIRTPSGTLRGHDGVRDLITRWSFGVVPVVEPSRFFARDDTLVVYATLTLRFAETGETAAPPEDSAAVFRIADGRVALFAPHPSREAAMEATGFTETDELG